MLKSNPTETVHWASTRFREIKFFEDDESMAADRQIRERSLGQQNAAAPGGDGHGHAVGMLEGMGLP